MPAALPKLQYPYVAFDPRVAGGAARIEGTRVTVARVAGYYQMGMNVDEILGTLPHLTAAQVHSALAYYFDHQDEVDRERAEAEDEVHWGNQVRPHPGTSAERA